MSVVGALRSAYVVRPGEFVALQSNLKDFSLADMFRLLASGRKTGTLHLSRDTEQARVCLEEGRVFFATSNHNTLPLGQRLVRANVVTDKQLRQALGLQKIQRKEKAGRRLGQILIDEGYIEPSLLESFLRDQIADTLFDLLRWDDGTLRFEPDDISADEDFGVAVSVETVISDASKRLEQWEFIKETVPVRGAKFSMAPAPRERSSEIKLTTEEWSVLRHLHGGRALPELVEVSGVGEFQAALTLHGLISAGLVAADRKEVAAASTEPARMVGAAGAAAGS